MTGQSPCSCRPRATGRHKARGSKSRYIAIWRPPWTFGSRRTTCRPAAVQQPVGQLVQRQPIGRRRQTGQKVDVKAPRFHPGPLAPPSRQKPGTTGRSLSESVSIRCAHWSKCCRNRKVYVSRLPPNLARSRKPCEHLALQRVLGRPIAGSNGSPAGRKLPGANGSEPVFFLCPCPPQSNRDQIVRNSLLPASFKPRSPLHKHGMLRSCSPPELSCWQHAGCRWACWRQGLLLGSPTYISSWSGRPRVVSLTSLGCRRSRSGGLGERFE